MSAAILSDIANFLEAEQRAITKEWQDVQSRARAAAGYTSKSVQVDDRLPRLLAELCQTLRSRTGSFDARPIADAQALDCAHWPAGFALDELILELEMLRHLISVTALAQYEERYPRVSSSAKRVARSCVHDFFAELTVASVCQHLLERQRPRTTHSADG